MVESRLHRPRLVATPETWEFCEKLAGEENLTALRVLSLLTAVGETVAKLNRMGIPVVAKDGDKEINIDIFNNLTPKT